MTMFSHDIKFSWTPVISISEKVVYPEYITIKDFFSYWFLLFATSIIPLLIFSTSNNEYYSIKIQDNGIGIDLEKFADKLFYPYQRFQDQSIGKGLGLYLAKLQTESLESKINITSEIENFIEVEVLLKK